MGSYQARRQGFGVANIMLKTPDEEAEDIRLEREYWATYQKKPGCKGQIVALALVIGAALALPMWWVVA